MNLGCSVCMKTPYQVRILRSKSQLNLLQMLLHLATIYPPAHHCQFLVLTQSNHLICLLHHLWIAAVMVHLSHLHHLSLMMTFRLLHSPTNQLSFSWTGSTKGTIWLSIVWTILLQTSFSILTSINLIYSTLGRNKRISAWMKSLL